MKIAGVRFRENWKVYDFDASDVEVSVGDPVVIDSERGLGFARVVRVREGAALPAPEQPPDRKKQPQPEVEEEIEIDIDDALSGAPAPERKTPQGFRRVLRKATEEDLKKEEKNRLREAEAFSSCQNLIAERELPMKLIRVEYSFDASRATFFFFSDTRVDFRELVKDLAHQLRSRIEMRQIGVRDVSRMIGGFGLCGRELCCTTFLKGFEPVSIRMAKKQEMVLNPAKISGTCGRLLCCLSYEYQMYDEIKKDAADMKETAQRARKEDEDRRLAEARREEEERTREEERLRQESRQARQREGRKEGRPQEKKGQQQEQRKGQQQEQKKGQQQEQQQEQRKGQQREQRGRQPEKKKELPQEQKARPQEKKEPAQEQQQAGEQQEQGGEKTGKRKRRRFWRKKKKPGSGPQQGPGGPPAQGA